VPAFNDEIWKNSIHALFHPMVKFHFPELYSAVDWSKECVFLEEELANLFSPERDGKRFVDVLAQITMKDGDDKYVLLHVEVQGYGSGEKASLEFGERMFEYYYRVRDKWRNKDIAALAILTDENPNFRPDRYEASFFGTTLTYVFNICKIIDHDEEELEVSGNPFATLMLAAKRALKANRGDDGTKMLFKLGLLRLCLRKGYSPDEIKALFFFLDWVVSFDRPDSKREFVREVKKLAEKEDADMRYVSSIEEVAREEAREKRTLEIARKMLSQKMDITTISNITELPEEELRKLAEKQLN
jgi:hypothetical protein